jgi:hypothetical protein
MKLRIGGRFSGYYSPQSGDGLARQDRRGQRAEVHRYQVMADTIAVELCQYYLDE